MEKKYIRCFIHYKFIYVLGKSFSTSIIIIHLIRIRARFRRYLTHDNVRRNIDRLRYSTSMTLFAFPAAVYFLSICFDDIAHFAS